MSEIDLIRNARDGDSKSFSRLYGRYQPVVFKIQSQYYLKDLEADDWHQEGQIIFFKTLCSYDEKSGVTLGYYFKLMFQRHIFNLLRYQGAEKRKTMHRTQSLENSVGQINESYFYRDYSAANSSFSYVILRDSLAYFGSYLSPLETRVFSLYLSGYSRQRIGNKLALTHNQVNNAIDRIKVKFKRMIN